MQCFFRENLDAHRYVASPRNQRNEGWWSQFARQRSNWWRHFFQDLVSRNEFDLTDIFQAEALWFAFSGLLQEEQEFVKEHRNTHKIRKIDMEPCLVVQTHSTIYLNHLVELRPI